MSYQKPILTVDIVLLTLAEDGVRAAFMQRTQEPFEGKYALTGGFVHVDEDENTDAAAMRILSSKLNFAPSHLEQVLTASGPSRDPRGWSASVVYLAMQPMSRLQPLVDAGTLTLVTLGKKGEVGDFPLAFDHEHLVKLAFDRLMAKTGYTTILAHFLESTFTIPELQAVYERVLRREVSSANFRRKILDLGALREVSTKSGVGRPSTTYRLKKDIAYFERPMI